MKRWIVEEDIFNCTDTEYFAVTAETREEAIRMVADGERDSFSRSLFRNPGGVRGYKDTHEATDEEWEAAGVR